MVPNCICRETPKTSHKLYRGWSLLDDTLCSLPISWRTFFRVQELLMHNFLVCNEWSVLIFFFFFFSSCMCWIHYKKASLDFLLDKSSALILTTYLLHDGLARKWEHRLKPLVLPIWPETGRSRDHSSHCSRYINSLNKFWELRRRFELILVMGWELELNSMRSNLSLFLSC